jgi:hypothetical protein
MLSTSGNQHVMHAVYIGCPQCPQVTWQLVLVGRPCAQTVAGALLSSCSLQLTQARKPHVTCQTNQTAAVHSSLRNAS